MPYEIETHDGIVLRNIPDDWSPDDDRLKSMVGQRRTQIFKTRVSSGDTLRDAAKANPAEYDPTSEAYQAKYGAAAGMGQSDLRVANFGAGMKNFGLGLAQLALPKAAERGLGITDESINERRRINQQLADDTVGGRAIQVAGEALPSLAIPAGAVARGLGAIPRVGAAAARAGIGSRVLPTLIAEGAAIGGLQGAVTPTTGDESALGNAVVGAGLGGVIPAGIAWLGYLARPLSRTLGQRQIAGQLGEALDVNPQTVREMQRAVASSSKRVVDAPQSAAALTQNPNLARLELAARANPDSAAGWQAFDEAAGNARWKALDEALGNADSVQAAKDATNAYVDTVTPEVFKRISRTKLSTGVADFTTALRGKLNSAVRSADPDEQQVYGYVLKALQEGDGSPRMLWNVRRSVSDWLEGTPPAGFEGTRGAHIDRPIMEIRKAIDTTLDGASKGGKDWSRFLENLSEHAQRETAQKSGQNIRNMFVDETLAIPRGATTGAKNPAVTRARLEQALAKHGKNQFGETLDWQQRNVVDQVLGDLRADEVLARAKSAMTGKGGSQTAPLQALLKKNRVMPGGSWIADIANAVTSFGAKRQREILNEVLQDPQSALTIVMQAEKLRRPLSLPEQRLVYAARSVLTAPAAGVLEPGPTDAAAQ